MALAARSTVSASRPLLVVSPHLDDAVFGCGNALAAHPDSVVITVFAGTPRHGAMATDWDRQCGFADAASAMQARREEDRRALAALQARPLWLDFCDRQYDEPATPRDVAAELERVLRGLPAGPVLIPFGLFHSDHLLAHEAGMLALSLLPDRLPLAYEDALYRALPGLLQQRLAALAQDGVCATPTPLPGALDERAKRQAVQAYASQLPLFGDDGLDDLWRPERCWALEGGPFGEPVP